MLLFFVLFCNVLRCKKKKRSAKRKKKAKTNQLIFAICTSQQQIVKSVAMFFLAHPDFYEWILPCAVIYSFDVSKIKKKEKIQLLQNPTINSSILLNIFDIIKLKT